jgi:tetratricopeptide repeat protein 21B
MYNHSCAKAWEGMGLIYEKEQSYRDAAESYENAWRLSHEHDLAIGYKLSFNYMKARRFVDAMDVAFKVLGVDDKYPRIRKDIIDKCRSELRP